MSTWFKVAWPVVLIGTHTVGLSAVLAQDADGLTIDISQCVVLESESDRLACYERLANAAIAAEPGAETRAPARPVPPPAAEPPSTSVQVGPDSRSSAAAPQESEDTDIRSRVASVEEYVPNRYRITLENGQVWRQMQAKRFLLRPGYHVRVYTSRWGESYRLEAEEVNGFIQVERER